MDSSVTVEAVSAEWSQAMPAGTVVPSPAARWVKSLDTAMAVAMSASLSWIAWCWQIGTPKAERCCE